MEITNLKFNQLTKILILFNFFLFFSSCETEKEVIINTKQNFKLKEISFSQLNTNAKLIKKISELKMISNDVNQKTTSGIKYNINTNHAIYIENIDGTNHSYTFAVNNQDENSNLENVILSLQEDGNYKAYLASYNLTEEELTNLNNGLLLDLTDKSSIEEINQNQINYLNRGGIGPDCTYELMTIEVEHACTIDGCWDPQYTTIGNIYVWVETCSSGGGGGNSSGGNNNTGGGGGSNNNGSTGNGSGNTPVITVPVGKTPNNKNPCQNLTESLNPLKQNLNQYINDLAIKHNQGVEKEVSYSFKKTPGYDPITDTDTYTYDTEYKEGTPTSVSINLGGNWHSAIHLHPKEEGAAAGIFSWGDIDLLNSLYRQVRPEYKEENDVSLMVLAPDPINPQNYNVYSITVKNPTNLLNAVNTEWNKWKDKFPNEKDRMEKINRAFGDKYVANKNNLERFFLDTFSNYGISLFKLQNNQWKELELSADKQSVTPKSCN